ncbi:MAG: type II toxin-antitoxin system RelE/ParE family toxin [Opitutae bacterium]|nr:type II toxin-antitoxin system RelE/ParE family toxin [Opitutae bacterium]
MKVVILNRAQLDLLAGFWFYEKQSPGVGSHYVRTLKAEIDSLSTTAGIHRRVASYHRHLVRKFSTGIYYAVEGDTVFVAAVLDCRRSPNWIRQQLR